MPFHLSLRTWWLILLDLSIDAAHPYFPAMGLARPEDVVFSQEVRALFEALVDPFTSDEGQTELVERAVGLTRGHGGNFKERLQDWGIHVYPNQSPLHVQVFRWRLLIGRGGLDGARDQRP